MRAITVYELIFTLVCGVFCVAEQPVSVRKIYLEKKTKNDLESQATGYIYRSDGDNPPIYIKLGTGNLHQFDNELKNAGITSNLEADRSNFGDLNIPAKSSYSTVKTNYMDINIPSKSSYSSMKSEYTDINIPAKSSYSAVNSDYPEAEDSSGNSHSSHTKPTFPSFDSDVFKEAFKIIPPLQEEKNFPTFKSSSHDDKFNNIKNIPEANDGYDNTDFEAPNPISNYKSSGEYDEPPPSSPYYGQVKAQPGKAYVAPHFDVPQPDEVLFNQRRAPVKYPLQPKVSKAIYGERIETAYEPAPVIEEHSDEDHNEFSSHYSADYHHKPEKHQFKKGGAEKFKEHHYSEHGEKGKKGYKKYHDFDEGEMGHHGKEGKKGYYDNESGHKKSHHHDGDKYGEVHGKLHGEKGVKYNEAEGHKKGHKTSGYHNIFHKDEFKKEHKFYDDAHKHGYHNKHGGYHTDHGKKHGHKAVGGFHDSEYDHGLKGNSGHHKKGHFDQDHKGHKGQSGHESHYNHHEDYGKKGGHSDSKKYGFDYGH